MLAAFATDSRLESTHSELGYSSDFPLMVSSERLGLRTKVSLTTSLLQIIDFGRVMKPVLRQQVSVLSFVDKASYSETFDYWSLV